MDKKHIVLLDPFSWDQSKTVGEVVNRKGSWISFKDICKKKPSNQEDTYLYTEIYWIVREILLLPQKWWASEPDQRP